MVLVSKGSSDNAPWNPCLNIAEDFSATGHVFILCMPALLRHMDLGSSGQLSHPEGTVSLFLSGPYNPGLNTVS